MNTRIITIEGIDGSGKTVQFELLKERLLKLGYTVAGRAYPVYDSFYGKQIGSLLSGSAGVKATEVDQKSMALWFALDRAEDFRNYHDGEADFLLINRYVLSNAVYQSIRDLDIGKPDIVDWVFDLEYNHLDLPRPCLNLFFDVELTCADTNVQKKGFRSYVGTNKDVYEADLSIQERARLKYAEIAERFDDTVLISCTSDGKMLPPESICDMVIRELASRGLIECGDC